MPHAVHPQSSSSHIVSPNFTAFAALEPSTTLGAYDVLRKRNPSSGLYAGRHSPQLLKGPPRRLR